MLPTTRATALTRQMTWMAGPSIALFRLVWDTCWWPSFMDVGRRPAGWGLAGVTGREALKVGGRSGRMNEQERQRRSQKGEVMYIEREADAMGDVSVATRGCRRSVERQMTGGDSSGERPSLVSCCIDVGLLALFWAVSSHGRSSSVEWSRRPRKNEAKQNKRRRR